MIEITLNGFEAYLEDVYAEENPETLDDNLSDSFSDWLSTLDGDNLREYAENYIQDMHYANSLAQAYFIKTFGK